MNGRDKLVIAMEELRDRRASGEPVHSIIDEVASEYGVKEEGLRKRAEATWGHPLETDRERHPELFELLENKEKVRKRAKEIAYQVWTVSADYIEKFSDRGIDWERGIKAIVESAKLDNDQLRHLAREEIYDELMRLVRLQKAGRLQPPPEPLSPK